MTTIPQHPFGLALYQDHLYWTDWLLHAVVRVHKYDSNDYTFLEENLHRQPMGIVVFAEDANDCKPHMIKSVQIRAVLLKQVNKKYKLCISCLIIYATNHYVVHNFNYGFLKRN
jgi:hypothetical protein